MTSQKLSYPYLFKNQFWFSRGRMGSWLKVPVGVRALYGLINVGIGLALANIVFRFSMGWPAVAAIVIGLFTVYGPLTALWQQQLINKYSHKED